MVIIFGIFFLKLSVIVPSDLRADESKSTTAQIQVQDQLNPAPFWKKKPQVFEEMKTERRIVVSAKTDKVGEAPKPYQMHVVTAGYVNVPIDRTWKIIQDFEKLPDVDERFQEVKYDSKNQKLSIHAKAYSYHARMTLQLKFGENESAKEMHFESVKGAFLGMKGVIRLEDDRRQKTEISMTSDYRSESLPLPRILMGVGLEVVASRVASSMRSYIEQLDKSPSVK